MTTNQPDSQNPESVHILTDEEFAEFMAKYYPNYKKPLPGQIVVDKTTLKDLDDLCVDVDDCKLTPEEMRQNWSEHPEATLHVLLGLNSATSPDSLLNACTDTIEPELWADIEELTEGIDIREYLDGVNTLIDRASIVRSGNATGILLTSDMSDVKLDAIFKKLMDV
jgi:hypothetical protein